MTATDNVNLVVSFKLAGDSLFRTHGATRIKLDGRGGLTVYDASTGLTEEFELAGLQSLAIHPVACARQAA